MSDQKNAYPVSRTISSAEDLTKDELKALKEHLETVGIEPSRIIADWLKNSRGLEIKASQSNGESGSGSDSDKEAQIARSALVAAAIERIRKELGPISGVDPVNAK